MPLFKYFVIVGTILIIGLFALSAYLEPVASELGGTCLGHPDDGVTSDGCTEAQIEVTPAGPPSRS